MRPLLAALFATAALAAATPATAAESVSAPLTFIGTSAFFGADKSSGGAFADTYTFDLPADAIASGALIAISLFPHMRALRDMELSAITISGPQGVIPYTLMATGKQLETYALLGTGLMAGTQTIRIAGTVAGGSGSYAGTFNIEPAAPVPEPSAWALLLAGFGSVGYSLRARRRRGSRQAV